MKILYLLRYYPTLTETFVYEEITALVEGKHAEIGIVSMGLRADGLLLKKPPAAKEIIALPKSRWARWFPSKSRGSRWLRRHQRDKDAARLSGLVEIARQYDHIHVHFAGEAAEVAYAAHLDTGISYSVTVHAVDLFRPRPSLETILSSAAGVITISSYNQSRLKRLGIESTIIRCGVDLDRWSVTPLPKGSLKALFVGRETEKKGLAQLIEAWSALDKKHQLTVIGPKKRDLSSENIRFLGPMPNEMVKKEMEQANLFILPCKTAANGDQDGIPVVLMEAMASGRPVISTAISGIPELVNTDCGWLIAPDSKIELNIAIKDAMNEKRREKKGGRGRMELEKNNFTRPVQTQLMANFFVKVV